jgi:hypothetical protein
MCRFGPAGVGVFALRCFSPLLLALLLVACAAGEYRMPYADGTDVLVRNDHVSHSSPQARMYDISGMNRVNLIVAAAPGWVRWIEDGNSTVGSGHNNYVWIEHPYPYCPTDPNSQIRGNWPGKPANYAETCTPCDRSYCNEWTVYAHMLPGTATGHGPLQAGLSQGDWVEAGQLIGVEGQIGQATNWPHLHWHVAPISPTVTPDADGAYEPWVATLFSRPELIPVVCHDGVRSVIWRNTTYTASGC